MELPKDSDPLYAYYSSAGYDGVSTVSNLCSGQKTLHLIFHSNTVLCAPMERGGGGIEWVHNMVKVP